VSCTQLRRPLCSRISRCAILRNSHNDFRQLCVRAFQKSCKRAAATRAPLYGFNGTVSFSCTGLPRGAGCSFSPVTVSGSGSTALTITTAKASFRPGDVSATAQPSSSGWSRMATRIGSACILLILLPRRRRRFIGQLMVALCATALTLTTSCGGNTSDAPGGSSDTNSPKSTTTNLIATSYNPVEGASDTSVLPAEGSYTVTATYSGDSQFLSSTSQKAQID